MMYITSKRCDQSVTMRSTYKHMLGAPNIFEGTI